MPLDCRGRVCVPDTAIKKRSLVTGDRFLLSIIIRKWEDWLIFSFLSSRVFKTQLLNLLQRNVQK